MGQIVYLSNGRMSAQIMRPGRSSTVAPGVDYGSSKATDHEIRKAVSGFVSYFGTYSIDETAGKVRYAILSKRRLFPVGWVPLWFGRPIWGFIAKPGFGLHCG